MPLLSLLTGGNSTLLLNIALPILKELAEQEAPEIEAHAHKWLSKRFPSVAEHGSPEKLATVVSHAHSLLAALKGYVHGSGNSTSAPE